MNRRQANVLVMRWCSETLLAVAADLPLIDECFEDLGLSDESLIEYQAKELARSLARRAEYLAEKDGM